MCAGHPRDAAANGSDVRGIRRRSETQGLNVLGSKTKVRKLFIIKRSEPRPYALLPGIVVSLNKSTHQARSGFQVLGRACGHASPQKLKVHDRLLFFLQKETEGPHRAGGRTSWTCGAPWWRKTPYVVQGARTSLRDLALQLSILRRIPSRQVARGFPFAGREYSRWRRGLVKEILNATHSDQCAVRHIRTCTSKALLDGIDVRLGSSTNCQVSFCFPTQAESCVGRSLPLVSPKCRPSFRHLLDQGLTCVTDCLFAHELCCVRCWRRPRSPRRSPLPGAAARRP